MGILKRKKNGHIKPSLVSLYNGHPTIFCLYLVKVYYPFLYAETLSFGILMFLFYLAKNIRKSIIYLARGSSTSMHFNKWRLKKKQFGPKKKKKKPQKKKKKKKKKKS